MTQLPDRFTTPNPERSARLCMPAEAMAYWSPEGWTSWLADGVRLFSAVDRQDRTLAFAPLTLDPDIDGPRELLDQLKSQLRASALVTFEEGLTLALAAWSWEDGAKFAAFLVQLAGLVEGARPRAALKAMFQKPIRFQALPDVSDLANSVAFLLSKRAHVSTIYDLLPLLEPLLILSRPATVLVASRAAVDDATDFVPALERLAPDLFNLPADHRDWRFVVNKLIERAGVERAVQAAYALPGPRTATFRTALQKHRLDLPTDRSGSRLPFQQVLDRVQRKEYRISQRYFESNHIHILAPDAGTSAPSTPQPLQGLFGGNQDVMEWMMRFMTESALGPLYEPDTAYDPADPSDDLIIREDQ